MPSETVRKVAANDLWSEFGQIEHARVEFKRHLGKGHGRQDGFVAMANTEGGDILIGIDDDRTVRGCEPQDTLDELEDVFHEIAWTVDPVVHLLKVGSEHVVHVSVPAQVRGVATTSDGRVVRRKGSRNRVLTGEHLVRFVAARAATPGDDAEVEGFGPDDVDLAALERYLKARGTPKVALHVDALGTLRSLGLATAGGVRVAGVVLFGTDPAAFIPGARLTFVRTVGVSPDARYSRREELTGPLEDVIRATWDIVFQEMRREAVVHGLVRREIPEYPPVAVREAIVNALVHRDYALRGGEVLVRMFDDRIEIQSPGSLPAGITEENIRNEQFSRNPRLTEALLQLGFMERLGEGMDAIYREMESHLLAPPALHNTEQSFTVTLRNQSLLSLDDKVWLVAVEALSHDALTVPHRLALVRARKGFVTNRALRDVAHITAEESRRALQELVERRLLKAQGERGGTQYVLAGAAAKAAELRLVSRRAQLNALLEHARVNGRITNREARMILGEDDPTLARNLLRRLTATGRLRRVGIAKGTAYLPVRRNTPSRVTDAN